MQLILLTKPRCEGHGLGQEAAPRLTHLDDAGDLVLDVEQIDDEDLERRQSRCPRAPCCRLGNGSRGSLARRQWIVALGDGIAALTAAESLRDNGSTVSSPSSATSLMRRTADPRRPRLRSSTTTRPRHRSRRPPTGRRAAGEAGGPCRPRPLPRATDDGEELPWHGLVVAMVAGPQARAARSGPGPEKPEELTVRGI